MEGRYYTAKEVAARLQVTEKTVRSWIAQGGLRAARAGHFWRISDRALRDFLRETGQNETSEAEGGGNDW
jgi:excisionase family DNA binding protein